MKLINFTIRLSRYKQMTRFFKAEFCSWKWLHLPFYGKISVKISARDIDPALTWIYLQQKW